jgi:hypothetical protein
VVVLWSRTSAASDWVKDEAADAAKRHILIPVLIEDIPIPLGFRRIQTLNLTRWDGKASDRQFQRLLDAVSGKMGNQPRLRDAVPNTMDNQPRTAQPVTLNYPNYNVKPEKVELISRDKTRRVFQVKLPYQNHIIDYMWGAEKDTVEVDLDGRRDNRGNAYRGKGKISFYMTDGPGDPHDGAVEYTETPNGIEGFRLIIDRRIVYQE